MQAINPAKVQRINNWNAMVTGFGETRIIALTTTTDDDGQLAWLLDGEIYLTEAEGIEAVNDKTRDAEEDLTEWEG